MKKRFRIPYKNKFLLRLLRLRSLRLCSRYWRGSGVAFPALCRRGAHSLRSLFHSVDSSYSLLSAGGWWCHSVLSRPGRLLWVWPECWVTGQSRPLAVSACGFSCEAWGARRWGWWWWGGRWHSQLRWQRRGQVWSRKFPPLTRDCYPGFLCLKGKKRTNIMRVTHTRFLFHC